MAATNVSHAHNYWVRGDPTCQLRDRVSDSKAYVDCTNYFYLRSRAARSLHDPRSSLLVPLRAERSQGDVYRLEDKLASAERSALRV